MDVVETVLTVHQKEVAVNNNKEDVQETVLLAHQKEVVDHQIPNNNKEDAVEIVHHVHQKEVVEEMQVQTPNYLKSSRN